MIDLTGRQVGNLVVRELLGRGKLGRTYRAEDGEGRSYALKALAPHLTRDARELAVTVARLQSLRHPHLVSTLGLVGAGGHQALKSEFVPGPGAVLRPFKGV